MKAITASTLASDGNPSTAKLSLDSFIKSVWETAHDMNSNYKERSKGGLAVAVNVADY